MSSKGAGSGSTSAAAADATLGRPSGVPSAVERPRSAKAAWLVIGTAISIGLVLGVFVYVRAANGSVAIASEFRAMRQRGATMDAEACVETSLAWFSTTCDAVGKMCIDAVPRMVGECLAAKDRSAACARIGNDLKPSQWAYHRCQQLGIDKKSPKAVKESCTLAWRAYDSWCKSGQRGVAL